VVLSVNNQDEILVMDERSEKSEIKNSASEPSETLSQPAEDPAKSIQLKYADIETAIEDVNQLMSQINIRPYFIKGKPEGLLLTRIQPDSFFNRIGLQSGDIITGVDGKAIETVDDALEIYERMKSASDMSLQLKRRGKPQIIDYHIE
jgi:general secretion pathway protein C